MRSWKPNRQSINEGQNSRESGTENIENINGMKTKFTMLFLLLPLLAFAQRESEVIKKSFKLNDTSKEMWFCVCNIEGDVEVEAYDGNTIEIEIQKEIRARGTADLKQGMDEVTVDFSEGDGYLRARLVTPYNRYREKDDPLACGWSWENHGNRVDYRFRLDFKVKVPRGISVKISTVNDSDLFIKGVQGEIYANNVNGDVELTDIGANTKANTVNGKIEVNYLSMPEEFAEFQTVNGDIEVYAPKNSNAVYTFETRYGEVFSDFDFSKKLAPKMVSTRAKRGGTMYKIAHANSYQVGDGGPSFEFKTLNGDILVRKGN